MTNKMGNVMQNAAIIAGLLLCGAFMGVLVVMALDPDCGPSGYDQTACAAEIARDLTPGRR